MVSMKVLDLIVELYQKIKSLENDVELLQWQKNNLEEEIKELKENNND